MKPRQHGFTLVELLIVIALLGALVIGLLAALDPVEQIRRGQDTGIRNTSSEVFNATNRYFTNKGQYPWGTNTVNALANTLGTDITSLMAAGELKANFFDRVGTANLNKIYVNSAGGTDLSVCFKPISKAMQVDSSTMYGSNGSTTGNTGCKSQTSTGGSDCHLCFR